MKNGETKTVKGVKVTGKLWEEYGKKRAYFTLDTHGAGSSAKKNQVCFDFDKNDFVYSCRDSFLKSDRISNDEAAEWEKEIRAAFSL